MSTVWDITGMLAGLRGDDYVSAMRGIAADFADRGGFACGGDGCEERAVMLGMHRCGAQGPPICELHYRRHQEWMAASAQLGHPYCRHCGEDIDSSHIYAVPL